MNSAHLIGPADSGDQPVRIDDPRRHEDQSRCAIVIGFDREASSKAAIRFAMDICVPLAAHLHVVHIIDLDDFPFDSDSPDYEAAADRVIASERAQARRLLANSPSPWTYYSERGAPSELLSSKADEVDALMIVIGASRGGAVAALDRLTGASVSSALSLRAHRPVLIVPAHRETDERQRSAEYF